MHKKTPIIVTLVIALGLYILIFSDDNDNDIKSISLNNKQIAQQEIATAKVTNQVSSPIKSVATSDTSNLLSYPKIPYQGDWCVQAVDLTEKDFQFAQQESADWAEKQGDIFFNTQNHEGNYYNLPNSDLLEPYKEMDQEQLVALAFKKDRHAMIAALQRPDIKTDIQLAIAKQLVVLGDSANALLFLSGQEKFNAEYEYEQEEKVTEKVKKYMKNSLLYVSYGISRYDTTALMNYLISLQRDELFKTVLDPTNVLSSQDFDEIRQNVQGFSKMIDELRSKENLVPLSQIDIPKIALHDFQETLAILYLDHGKNLDKLQPLNLATGPNIKRTACVSRYAEMYGEE